MEFWNIAYLSEMELIMELQELKTSRESAFPMKQQMSLQKEASMLIQMCLFYSLSFPISIKD
jgi:hypothetical protein